MHTVPIDLFQEAATRFDINIQNTFESILGTTLSTCSAIQSQLGTSLGGIVLRKVVTHADAAFVGSILGNEFIRSQTLIDLKPEIDSAVSNIIKTVPVFNLDTTPSQKSDQIDISIKSDLISNYPEQEARLNAVCRPHAAAWILAPPCKTTGTWMEDTVFCMAINRWLGVDVALTKNNKCLDCHTLLTPKASHTTCCLRKGDITTISVQYFLKWHQMPV